MKARQFKLIWSYSFKQYHQILKINFLAIQETMWVMALTYIMINMHDKAT